MNTTQPINISTMKAMNEPQTIIRRVVSALLTTLFFCAVISAQEVFRRDTTLTHVYRNLISFPIPQGTDEVDIKVRFSIREVSLAGVLFTSPSNGDSVYPPELLKVSSGGCWEYALNYNPDHSFACDRLACIPAGDYYFHFRREGISLADTLRFFVVVDNLPGVTETDTPVRFLPNEDVEYVPEPDTDPSYPGPVGPGRTMTHSHILHRRMTDTSGSSYTEDIRYFDGLGREVQTVLVGASPDGSDLAGFTDYSKRGREWRHWNSAPVQGLSGAFVSDLPKRAREYHGDSRPHTETLHSECPLDRPLVETERGDAWLEHPARYSYLCNDDHGTLSCRRFSVSPSGDLLPAGLYPSGMLNVVKHTNEDGHVSYTFTDKQDRTVLERRMDGDEAHDTHYVYDVSGLLRFVLPPAMDGDFSEEVQDKYAYRYAYDGLGRLESKELHGSAAETLTYSYNIQDWLTGINSEKFTQTLGYDDHYIGSMSWDANSTSHSYTFSYDGLNRMLDAVHGTGAYTEKVREYGKNGNIKGLQRYGNGLIDNLTYTYDGNQLTQVEDSTGNVAGFNNGANATNEYTYDNNGNLTKDSNKKISEIAYNYLCLQQKNELCPVRIHLPIKPNSKERRNPVESGLESRNRRKRTIS